MKPEERITRQDVVRALGGMVAGLAAMAVLAAGFGMLVAW